jgi:nicotinamide-nucleotide amidase
MYSRKTAIVLSVGTELTEGVILNTHFRFLGAELKGLGFRILRCVQIPDDGELYRRELREAVRQADLVICTGGLGPTSDDLTREIVAEVAGVDLSFDLAIWEALVARYASTGRRIADTNRRQANIPSGFQILPNQVGTAPGFSGMMGEALLVALPGPPAELEEMFVKQALPAILERFEARGRSFSADELVCTALMIPESVLEEALLDARRRYSAILWGTRVGEDRIVVTLRGAEPQERESVFQELGGRFGPVKIRRGEVRPSLLLFDLLRSRGESIALAESCTGGLVAKLLTDIPGSSQVFWGAVTAYSNAAKVSLLGVPEDLIRKHGAVSAEVASAMSAGILEKAPAQIGLSVTGIAGPEGGTVDKPVGTVWISARRREGQELCRSFLFPGSRDSVRRRSVVAALLLAECLLLGLEAGLVD